VREPYDGSMTTRPLDSLRDLPGIELVEQGLEDLRAGRATPESALVSMAAPRLNAIGVAVPLSRHNGAGHCLYSLLSDEDRASAHSRYNALVARIVSFARAAEHAPSG